MKNYRIDLEHVTDGHIDIHDSAERVTKKAAINAAIKMSKSELAKQLLTEKNQYGDLPNVVRVFVYSEEDEDGCRHTMMFVNGVCTYDTVG